MRIFRAARFLFAMGLTVDTVRLLRGTVLALALYVAAPLAALALRDFTDDVLARHAGPALAAAVLASVALVAQVMLPHFCHLDLSRVTDELEMRLRRELMDLVNGPPRIDHLDSSDVADTVALVRDSLFATARSLDGALQLAGLLLQMIITVVLLVMVSPLFAFLPLCAVVPVLAERTAQGVVEDARERAAGRSRLAGHLLEVAQPPRVRSGNCGCSVPRTRSCAVSGAPGTRCTAVMWRAQLRAALYRALGQGFFALGYTSAIAAELYSALHGHGFAGSLVLVITLAVQVSSQVSGILGVLSLLQVAARTTDRIGVLRAVAADAGLARTRAPRGQQSHG